MFKPISVVFPEASTYPQNVYKAVLYQKIYEHEMLVLTFKDWDVIFDEVRPGTPVSAKITGSISARDFFGYIHHIVPNNSPGKRFTEVVCIGGSFPMKQASRKVYREHTADMVVGDICRKHNLSFIGIPHPRVFDQVSQAGYTGWQMAVKLAKQIGYTLRAENTEVYFEPVLNDYAKYRLAASKFVMRDTADPRGSTLYSFQPLIGESLEFDGEMKAAVAVSGVDRFAKVPMSQTKQKRNTKTRSKAQDEFFDRFNSLVVAPNAEIAKYESEAAEARTSFPYRGQATVLGDPSLRPNMPVFLDGLGNTYSGFWTILGTEHVMVETERNVYTYTTNLSIGSDSVGLSQTVGGVAIAAPPDRPLRVVTPGIKQTKTKAGTKLVQSRARTNNRNTASFGKIENRSKVTAKVKTPAVWKSSNPTPKVKFVDKKVSSLAVASRKKGPR